MNTFTEGFEKFAELQKEGFEPARKFTAAAVEVFETVARKNIDVMGDVLNYAVEAAKLPTSVSQPSELFEKEVAAAKDLAETLTKRANEYLEIGQSFQETAEKVINTDVFTAAVPQWDP
ncbi:MAG: phasin family protein, partial [Pseudomonadota bacterium]